MEKHKSKGMRKDQQWWDDGQWSSGAWTNSDWQWQQPPWNQPPLPPPSQPPPWQGDDGEESDVPWDPEAMNAGQASGVLEGQAAAAADTTMTGLDAEPLEEPEVLGDDQPQPEPPFEGHEEGEEVVYPWDEMNLEDGMAENPASSAYPTAGDAPMLGPGYAPTSGDLFTDNLNVEHVLNKMHQQPNVAPDFSQQTQIKTGWMNRCVLLVALWKERRFKHLEHVCNKFGEHYSISNNVRCLQSHIRKHGDKGPALMGYKY
eukprot:Skav207897  [mRNA]  locus=scaffold2233:87351:88624:+ [translate_table: standard]